MTSGKLFNDIDLPAFNIETDRFMICGSPAMLKDCCTMLDERGFKESRQGNVGQYVIERAFVES
jgi:ferredoxin--NADP+ reductase